MKEYNRILNSTGIDSPDEPWTEESLDKFCKEHGVYWYENHRGCPVITNCGKDCECTCGKKLRPEKK